MRISDWSSDVCSSDLGYRFERHGGLYRIAQGQGHRTWVQRKHSPGLEHFWGLYLSGCQDYRWWLHFPGSGREWRCARNHGSGSFRQHRTAIPPDSKAQLYRVDGLSCHARHQHRRWRVRSEEHTSELQSLMRISYAVFCLKKKKKETINNINRP